MIKSAGKKLLVAVLGICAALTMIFGVANFNRNGKSSRQDGRRYYRPFKRS